MLNKNRKKNSRGVYLKQEFDTYVLWKSLPSFLRGQPAAVLHKMGFDDSLAMELLTIKNQTEFAKKYDIGDLGTLTDWNKRISEEGLVKNINDWARQLTPNVIFALYKNVSKKGRAQEARAWFDLVENN